MRKPLIHNMTVSLSQENDTEGESGEYLTVELRGLWIDHGGGYAVIKTEGWSFDDSEDVSRLIGVVQGAAIGLKMALGEVFS